MARRATALALGLCLAIAIQSCAAAATQEGAPPSGGGSYKAAYHYVVCEADHVVNARNTADVADAVKTYRELAAQQGAKLKIRASRHLFHSTTSFVCPNQLPSLPGSGGDGGEPVLSVAILHDNMNETISYDGDKFTMRVGPGMKIRELAAEATRLGMSIQVGSLPAYAGLTLGGILSTSAHGSGDNATSNICDTLISLTWVDVQGNVRRSKRDTPEARLFCGGLGLIGIITEIELQMTPPTHTKLITRYLANDTDIVSDVEKLLQVSPHILVFWRPDLRLYSAYMLKATTTDVPASDAYMSLLPSFKGRPSLASLFEEVQEDVFDQRFPAPAAQQQLMCPTVAITSVGKTWASYGNGRDALYAVGETNSLVAAECWEHCGWNSPVYNGTTDDVHLSIEWENFRSWVDDVKSILDHDLWSTDADQGRCLGPGYIWLRFGHGGPDYLSMHYGMKRPVYVQSTWLKSRSVMDRYPMRYGFVLDLVEEMSLCKYKGRPHWGKNFARTFTHPRCPIADRFPGSFDTALAVQHEHDPKGVFEPALFTKVKARQQYDLYPGCALHKDCYCEEDAHCPEKHRCTPSLTPGLESYKLCKPDWRLVPGTHRSMSSSGR